MVVYEDFADIAIHLSSSVRAPPDPQTQARVHWNSINSAGRRSIVGVEMRDRRATGFDTDDDEDTCSWRSPNHAAEGRSAVSTECSSVAVTGVKIPIKRRWKVYSRFVPDRAVGAVAVEPGDRESGKIARREPCVCGRNL